MIEAFFVHRVAADSALVEQRSILTQSREGAELRKEFHVASLRTFASLRLASATD
jgi:hypothetical protein